MAVLLALVHGSIAQSCLVITGVIAGTLDGGYPGAIEVYATCAVADASVYGLGSANNGGGSAGQEFTFAAVPLDAGDYYFVRKAEDGRPGFAAFFGFEANQVSHVAKINGDESGLASIAHSASTPTTAILLRYFSVGPRDGARKKKRLSALASAARGQHCLVPSRLCSPYSALCISPYQVSHVAKINGDDAIELFQNGQVVDVFGEIDRSGFSQPWEYYDSWAYRVSNTGHDGSTFVLSHWSFGGPNKLDGATTNAAATTPFPLRTYTAGSVSPQAIPPPPSALASASPSSAPTSMPPSPTLSPPPSAPTITCETLLAQGTNLQADGRWCSNLQSAAACGSLNYVPIGDYFRQCGFSSNKCRVEFGDLSCLIPGPPPPPSSESPLPPTITCETLLAQGTNLQADGRWCSNLQSAAACGSLNYVPIGDYFRQCGFSSNKCRVEFGDLSCPIPGTSAEVA
jgi:hypothetical protein